MEKRIIIAEDDNTTRVALSEFLSKQGYSVQGTENGADALELYKKIPSQIVITDLEMPGMEGSELIDNLKTFESQPVIFVTTSHKDPELIINIMKKGVYDYIIKPVDFSELFLKISRAFEQHEMKHALEITEKEKMIRLENSLEWFKFTDHFNSTKKLHSDQNLFDSLLTSLNQGPGFGTLITLIGIIASTATKQGEDYLINGEVFEAVKKNVAFAEKGFETFSDISNISEIFENPQKISISGLYEKLDSYMKSLSDLVDLRNHAYKLSDLKELYRHSYVEIDEKFFIKAYHEVFVNALKFSPAGSKILVLLHISDKMLTISVLNEFPADSSIRQGIPMGYENLVFEPFYRMSKVIHEQYGSLDYGLGLTLAEKVILKHNGKIVIHNINDYSDLNSGSKLKVECAITLPLTE
ncbi:MAG: response regulator [Spirochaetes bacterium]|nr:response regulator [Spirochaetota bacterium]